MYLLQKSGKRPSGASTGNSYRVTLQNLSCACVPLTTPLKSDEILRMDRLRLVIPALVCLLLFGCGIVTQDQADQDPTGALLTVLVVVGVLAAIALIYFVVKQIIE